MSLRDKFAIWVPASSSLRDVSTYGSQLLVDTEPVELQLTPSLLIDSVDCHLQFKLDTSFASLSLKGEV